VNESPPVERPSNNLGARSFSVAIFLKTGERNKIAEHWRGRPILNPANFAEADFGVLAIILAHSGWCGRPDFDGYEQSLMVDLCRTRFDSCSACMGYIHTREESA